MFIDNIYSSGEWLFWGDESGAKVPNEIQRYSIFTIVGLPKIRYTYFKAELPKKLTKKGFKLNQFKTVSDVLVQNGGVSCSCYFDLHNDKIINRVLPQLKDNRKKALLSKPPSVFYSFYTNLLAFTLLETLMILYLKRIPVTKCSFVYDGFDINKHVETLMPKFCGMAAIEHSKAINVAVKQKFPGFDKWKPELGGFKAGRTNEYGIMAADLCASFTNAYLSGKVNGSNNPIIFKDLTHIMFDKRAAT